MFEPDFQLLLERQRNMEPAVELTNDLFHQARVELFQLLLYQGQDAFEDQTVYRFKHNRCKSGLRQWQQKTRNYLTTNV